MFHRLHSQMTAFSAAITSLILIAMTCVCLFISEGSLKAGTDASFSSGLATILSHLQNQNNLSLQWIKQVQETDSFRLCFYDNGAPLFSRKYYSTPELDSLAALARREALSRHGMDIASTNSSILPEHVEFSITDAHGTMYYASAGTLPRNRGTLGFIILYSLEVQQRQILRQRLLFTAVDLAAILLLTLFARKFTGRMLLPLEENRRKQIYFTAAASHELRAPLTVILSGVEALKKTEEPAQRRHFFQIIAEEGARMQNLITDMLFLSRSDSGTFHISARDCQPELLLLDAYEKHELPAHHKKLSLSVRIPEEQLPACHADPERVAQIFSILLDNAFSYTPEGGAVALTLSISRNRSRLLFTVSDNGPGIPDAEKAHVFDRFYRMESSHTDKRHSGLGLCIAKELAAAHHGSLRVEDAPEGGAAFILSLPPA